MPHINLEILNKRKRKIHKRITNQDCGKIFEYVYGPLFEIIIFFKKKKTYDIMLFKDLQCIHRRSLENIKIKLKKKARSSMLTYTGYNWILI